MIIEKSFLLYIDDPLSVQYADECIASAAQSNIQITKFKGLYKADIQTLTTATTGVLCPNDKAEYCTAVGHFLIWKEIAKLDKAAVVLEHDSIIKHDYCGLEVLDNEILFLGPKVYAVSDYEFPNLSLQKVQIRDFEGAYAYAITPATAKTMIKKIRNDGKFNSTVDGYLGLCNLFKFQFYLVDPPCVIVASGARKSFTQEVGAWSNRQALPGFKAGLTREYAEQWFSVNKPE